MTRTQLDESLRDLSRITMETLVRAEDLNHETVTVRLQQIADRAALIRDAWHEVPNRS